MENNHIHEIYHTIEDTFDYLGKKWSIKIIKGFFCHCIHFKDFLEMNPDLSSKVLSERLKELEQKGIIEKRVINSSPVQTEYHLTVKGETTENPSEEFNLQLKEELEDLFQV